MESNESLHSSVQEFKKFVTEHPLIAKEVSANKKKLQDFYEEWSILGAEHEQWTAYKRPANGEEEEETKSEESTNEKASATLGQIMDMMKSMNVETCKTTCPSLARYFQMSRTSSKPFNGPEIKAKGRRTNFRFPFGETE